MITTHNALAFCTRAEKTLRPLGYHIGLTGSLLYGHPDAPRNADDLDVIIYPHIEEDGSSKSHSHKPKDVMKALGVVSEIHHIERGTQEDYGCVTYIYVGRLKDGTKLDAFFLK